MMTDPEEDYARGFVRFLDVTVRLDSRPLIPRTETEYWVEQAIETMKHSSEPLRCLDLFAGSGAIGLAVLKHIPQAMVDFGEIDPVHFPTIQKSLSENSIDQTRARCIETDVYSKIEGRYDALFANPPYLNRSATENIQPSVLTHEPDRALFADDAGFALIEKTIQGFQNHATADGVLYLEHDPEQSVKIVSRATSQNLTVKNYLDQYGKLRWSVLRVA